MDEALVGQGPVPKTLLDLRKKPEDTRLAHEPVPHKRWEPGEPLVDLCSRRHALMHRVAVTSSHASLALHLRELGDERQVVAPVTDERRHVGLREIEPHKLEQ